MRSWSLQLAGATLVFGGSLFLQHSVALASSTAAIRPTLSLPSDGWKPGESAFTAEAFGALHGVKVSGRVGCAWLGPRRSPFEWPAGYRLRVDPIELVDGTGRVVGKSGEGLAFGGEGAFAKVASPCGGRGKWTFYVQSFPVSLTK